MIKISFSDQIEKFPGRTDGRTDGRTVFSIVRNVGPFCQIFRFSRLCTRLVGVGLACQQRQLALMTDIRIPQCLKSKTPQKSVAKFCTLFGHQREKQEKPDRPGAIGLCACVFVLSTPTPQRKHVLDCIYFEGGARGAIPILLQLRLKSRHAVRQSVF